jgi:hypothetical protein
MADLLLLTRFFPYDPSIDGPLGHRHLILIYCITWSAHVAYVAFIAIQWRANKKSSGW